MPHYEWTQFCFSSLVARSDIEREHTTNSLHCALCTYHVGTDADLEPDEVEEALLAYKNRQCCERPILAVEVKDGCHGATHIWSMEKFK